MREPPLTLGFEDEPPEEDEDRRGLARPQPTTSRSGTAPSATSAPASPSTSASGFVVRTDGAARGNPGPASAGAVLISLARRDARDPLAAPDASISDYLGTQTNNVAEYTAVVRAVALALELGARRVELLLDSKLIVEQLAGRWRVKDAKLRPLWAEALRQLRALPDGWVAAHVPRAQNSLADAMCNEAIDRVMAGGPASVHRRPPG
jgi:ribonuclease HI